MRIVSNQITESVIHRLWRYFQACHFGGDLVWDRQNGEIWIFVSFIQIFMKKSPFYSTKSSWKFSRLLTQRGRLWFMMTKKKMMISQKSHTFTTYFSFPLFDKFRIGLPRVKNDFREFVENAWTSDSCNDYGHYCWLDAHPFLAGHCDTHSRYFG